MKQNSISLLSEKLRYVISTLHKTLIVSALGLMLIPLGFSQTTTTEIPESNPEAISDPQVIRPVFRNPRFIDNPEILEVRTTRVPQLVGLTFRRNEIIKRLEVKDLVLGEVFEIQDNSKINIVVEQSRPFNTRVRKGSSINITIGIAEINEPEAEGNIEMPDYRGIHIRNVRRMMRADRLTFESSDRIESLEEPGIVLSHFPEPGMIIDPFTEVEFVISSGPGRVEVPPIIGASLDEAAAILKEAGLYIGEENVEISDITEGIILNQNPRAGNLVEMGSFVDIVYTVQQFDKFTTVPFVIQLKQNAAIRKIKEAQLNYTIERIYDSNQKEGVVIDQSPPASTEVPLESNVHIIVAKDRVIPPAVAWGTGILVAGLVGGLLGRKAGRKRRLAKKTAKLSVHPVYHFGDQEIEINDKDLSSYSIHLNFVPDHGNQEINL